MADATPSFWSTLENGAISTASRVLTPLSGSLTNAWGNVVGTAQNKVAQAGQSVVQATSQAPTGASVKTTPSIPDAQTTAAAASSSTIIGLFAAIVLIYFLVSKKG